MLTLFLQVSTRDSVELLLSLAKEYLPKLKDEQYREWHAEDDAEEQEHVDTLVFDR